MDSLSQIDRDKEKKILSTQKQHPCWFSGCDRIFNKLSYLKDHFLVHTGERPYTCHFDLCGSSFRRETHLKIHIQSVHQKSSYSYFPCPFATCFSSFSLRDNLVRHERLSHSYSITANDSIPPILIECLQFNCNAIFATEKQRKKHLSEFHSSPNLHNCVYSLHGCQALFRYPSQIKSHGLSCKFKPIISALIISNRTQTHKTTTTSHNS